MTHNNRNTSNPQEPAEHLEALDRLLSLLKENLIESGAKKGTYGDYLRLLEFYREMHANDARDILVSWVDNELHDDAA